MRATRSRAPTAQRAATTATIARAKLWLSTAVLLAGLVALIVASRALRTSLDARPCPPATHQDATRERQVRLLVATLPDGTSLLRTVPFARFCFGETRIPSTTSDRRLLLDAAASDAETAARVRHLLTHHTVPFAPVQGFDAARPCAAQIDAALDAEAHALVREVADRVRLRLVSPRLSFAFSEAVLHAPDDATRASIVRAFIDAHPHGGGGIDAVASGYAAECARTRAITNVRASAGHERAAP